MFYPFIIVIPVVTHSNAYGVVCHPNALLLVDVYVVNGVAVHGVVSVEVSDDIGFGRVSLHIHFVDTGTVCGYKYFFVSESNDTVYADVRQTGFYEGCFVELEVIYIHASLKSSDKDFAASLVIEKFVYL